MGPARYGTLTPHGLPNPARTSPMPSALEDRADRSYQVQATDGGVTTPKVGLALGLFW
jgi:hypothetical protein